MKNIGIILLLLLSVISCELNNSPTFHSLSIDVSPEGAGIVKFPSDTLIEDGTSISLRAIPGSDYRFSGWSDYGTLEYTTNPLDFSVSRDMELTAEFVPLPPPYEVKLNIIGNGNVADWDTATVKWFKYGTTVRLQAEPDTTWVFRRWEGDFNSEAEVLEFVIYSDVSIDLIFEEGVIDYCLPTSLEAFRHEAVNDSIKILDWDYEYDGRFITSYDKIIDYSKTGEKPIAEVGELTYNDGNIARSEHTTLISNAKDIHEFSWSIDELVDLTYSLQSNSNMVYQTYAIIYEEPCGLLIIEGERISPGDGSYLVEYNYLNNCKTYDFGGDEKIYFSEGSSIYKDIEGIPRFLGARYDYLFAEPGYILLPNMGENRISKLRYQPIGKQDVGSAMEVYQYLNFIIEDEYPTYFTSQTTYTESNSTDTDSYVVKYTCGYK